MKKYNLIATIVMIGISTSCMSNAKDSNKNDNSTKSNEKETVAVTKQETSDSKDSNQKKITVELNASSNSNATGSVTFEENDGKVSMTAKINGLKPGMHAIHLHKNADCTSDDGKSAGGHWNPTNEEHGKWGAADGYHRGDIGNFEADADGKVTYKFSTDEWCIGCDNDKKNIIGRSVIIHEGKDDFTSQPSGDAGKRVACAAITKK